MLYCLHHPNDNLVKLIIIASFYWSSSQWWGPTKRQNSQVLQLESSERCIIGHTIFHTWLITKPKLTGAKKLIQVTRTLDSRKLRFESTSVCLQGALLPSASSFPQDSLAGGPCKIPILDHLTCWSVIHRVLPSALTRDYNLTLSTLNHIVIYYFLKVPRMWDLFAPLNWKFLEGCTR